MELLIKQKIQCGDIWLLKFQCPRCSEFVLAAYPLSVCSWCNYDIGKYSLAFTQGRGGTIHVVGTMRKRISRIGKATIRKLLIEQGSYCIYCNEDLLEKDYHVDHIVPLCVGGSNNLSNLAITCPECNFIAGGRVFNSLQHKKLYILENRKQCPSTRKTRVLYR